MIPTPPLVFLDTETTGVHPDRQVWEIGMIRRDDSAATLHEIDFMVEVNLSHADPFGLSVGRFYERHPHGRYLSGVETEEPAEGEVVDRMTAAERVAAWTHGAHIVGAVPNFDTETLDWLLRQCGLLPAWHYHLIDVENLAVGYLHGLRARMAAVDGPPAELLAPPWSSEELSRACGVEPAPPEERHTALGDARWAMRLYDAITGGTGQTYRITDEGTD